MLTQEPFKIHSITRQKLVGFLEHLTPEQLAEIPEGFNNNIWWNVTHCVVTQQLLTYHLSKNEMLISMDWVEGFKKGSKPDGTTPSPKEISFIKDLLSSTQQKLQVDYFAEKLNNFNEYPTSYGYTLNSIDDAILFNLMHESMHLGTILAIKKLV